MTLSKKELGGMKKDDLVGVYLKLQSEFDSVSSLHKKLDVINEKFEKLHSELIVSKNVNSLLSERVKELEKRLSETEQYSRRECLEIAGIPLDIPQSDLESKVLDIFGEIGVVVEPKEVEACHRIRKKGLTIIKLSRRKDIHRTLANKKKLKSLDSTKIGLGVSKMIYINESLCGTYRNFWFKCKMLHKHHKIHSFWTSNGHVKLRMSENGQASTILHNDDLTEIFPDIDFDKLATVY